MVFEYVFMKNALLAGVAIAGACSLLGVFLILRNLAMLGDGLAHASFGGIAAGILFKINPIVSAFLFALANAVAVKKLMKNRVYGDAAIAVIFSFGMALAVMLIGIAKAFKSDIFSYLFGSILTASKIDVALGFIVFAIVLSTITIFYRELFLISFNEEIAHVNGINVDRFNTVVILLASAVVVVAIKVAGVLLASSFLVIPALTALQISASFKKSLIFSLLFSEISTILGIFMSFYLNVPTSGIIVMIMIFIFLTLFLAKILRK